MPTPEPKDGAAGLFVGRYRLGPLLGSGGSASVHEAMDERLMRQVAIKGFRHDADPDLIRRFEAEARILARLHHPGLVEIFDFGHTARGPYLVLELLPGPSLSHLLHSGPRPLTETLRTGAELAQTLAYVHSQGVVHRDVKPSNILLDQDGCPRLADFGISRVVDTAGSTRTGTVMGTAAYLAPEQVTGQGAGPEADVYALGLVMIECLTAEREYPGSAAESAVARLRRSPRIPAGLPGSLTQVLSLMTCADPEERISADECARLLSAAALEHTAAPPAAAGPPTAPLTAGALRSATGRHRGRPVAAVAVALAASGLVWSLVAANNTDSPPPPPAHSAGSPSATSHATTGTPVSAPDASATALASTTGPAATRTIAPSTPAATAASAKDRAKGKGHGHGHGK